MEEQTEKLNEKHVPTFYFNSSLTEVEMDFTINALTNKDTPYAILFTSQECVLSLRLCNVLKKWNETKQLIFLQLTRHTALIRVWGVAFQPDFLNIGMLWQFNICIWY